MTDQKVEPKTTNLEKYPRTKASIAILLAITACLKFMGLDIEPILKAREGLVIATIEFEQSKMQLEMRRLEFEMYSGNGQCTIDSGMLKRMEQVEKLAHPKG